MAKKKKKQSTIKSKSKQDQAYKYVVIVKEPIDGKQVIAGFYTIKNAKLFMRDVFNEMGLETAMAYPAKTSKK